jgi:hypothetical protein
VTLSDSDIPSPRLFSSWFVAAIVVVVVLAGVGAVTGAAGDVFGIFVNRKAVEQSVQYSTANTDEFYTDLAAVKKVDVQIAALPADDPQLPALRSQRDFLAGECRRAVAKLPADARTPDMTPYLPGAR